MNILNFNTFIFPYNSQFIFKNKIVTIVSIVTIDFYPNY